MAVIGESLRFARPEKRHGLPVIALHCSGADGRQWRHLADALDEAFDLIAPEFYGAAGKAPWGGAHAFTLADEAQPILDLVDALATPVHLVGHSYGGGVALHIALKRPQAIASLALYEPSAFHLLRQAGRSEVGRFAEIKRVAAISAAGVASGDYQGAARHFVDYWSGKGSWDTLRPSLQAALTRWSPKAPLDFHALIEEPSTLAAYAALPMPLLILRGQHAPAPTAAVAALLDEALPHCRKVIVAGAGHMGPVTHAEAVAGEIARFLAENKADRPSSREADTARQAVSGAKADAFKITL